MQAIIFIGIQASGKSTFYQRTFFHSHVRINLDMLKTRNREQQLLETCLRIRQPFVIDNTNPTIADRQRYIPLAQAHQFSVVGYYFQAHLSGSIERNQQRTGKQHIPEQGIRATHARLSIPTYAEGFDALYYVRIVEKHQFEVQEWSA